jgi:cellulose synthase/poly-beta-1,6-N-acetylglucosamine synthase-like glycosyltransferase
MLYYYHHDIGFVARSTVDRRGKFKKASNLNSHLQLALGAAQLVEQNNPKNKNNTKNASSNNSNNDDDSSLSNGNHKFTFQEALLAESHNANGSRFVMFGNDISIGHLICVNDADARMSPSVILKTVPEFLNDASLGFTQHTTKTMTEQRGESYYTNLLAVYTDALYQGHFLLSSIMGCHPPLVGHSIFLRTEAVKQCGRMRMLRHAQRWLRNIGLPFLPVDQVGFSNLQANNRAEYWSESHVSEDFELMIHLYNLGFNGRYCAYPDCEFEEGITRTFDEEAGRHRKFALGAHELVFNPLSEWFGHGIFTPLFRTFITCDIPAYYKVFLTAYLCSYSSGGAYIVVFTLAAAARLIDVEDSVQSLYTFSPAGIIVLNIVAFYVIGYICFLFAMLRMHYINNKLLFPEYRKKWCGALYIMFVELRYCMVFQFLFYTVTRYAKCCVASSCCSPDSCALTSTSLLFFTIALVLRIIS